VSPAAVREPITSDPITVYGAATCEDTAITRSRLDALGVPYRYVDIDADADGAAEVVRLNGRRVTPTMVREAGDGGDPIEYVAEPPVERVDELARAAGGEIAPPDAEQLHGPVVTRAVPYRTLGAVDGGTFSLAELRGRRAAAILFAHGPDCLACFGYAKQLAGQAAGMDDADAEPIVAVRGDPSAAAAWEHELPPGGRLVTDPDGRWRTEMADAVGGSPDGVLLVLVDRFGAPRARSAAPEAGGLAAPSAATDWLRFVALDCPECSGEIAWPD